MNIIHSTFNRVNTSYTVIGGKQQSETKNIELSALLISRGGRPYRQELYRELIQLNVTEIVSIETESMNHYDLEKECVVHKELKFLILQKEVSIGEMINIGISEATGKSVLVLWDDIEINSKKISYRVFEKIIQNKCLCTVPVLKNGDEEVIPSLMTPLFNKELLKVVPLQENKSSRSLFPYMYMGIYNKELFVHLGGYDVDIKNSYWQKLDFGLRAHMWGEDIIAHNAFLIKSGRTSHQIEDITPDKDYRLYSLKNLSVIIKKDVGYLPLRRFFSYYDKSGSTVTEAWKAFIDVRKWVKINRFRFKCSAPELTTGWDEV